MDSSGSSWIGQYPRHSPSSFGCSLVTKALNFLCHPEAFGSALTIHLFFRKVFPANGFEFILGVPMRRVSSEAALRPGVDVLVLNVPVQCTPGSGVSAVVPP